MKKLILTMVWTVICLSIFAQKSTKKTNIPSSPIKSVSAVRIENAPKIDGIEGEPEWITVPVASNFVENQPTPGQQPIHKTEVKVMYDNTALYVFAVMYDTSPDSIDKQLSERDGIGNADWFGVFLDPYQDGNNGVSFIVTTADKGFLIKKFETKKGKKRIRKFKRQN